MNFKKALVLKFPKHSSKQGRGKKRGGGVQKESISMFTNHLMNPISE